MDGSAPIAQCSLDLPEKTHRKIQLYSDKIVVIRGRKTELIPLESVKSISLSKKVLLFPAILGGILMPLALLGAFNGIGSPWILIILAFIGLIGIYFGTAGEMVLDIESNSVKQQWILLDPHPYLKDFIQLTEQFIAKGGANIYRICLSPTEIESLSKNEELVYTEGKVIHLTDHQTNEGSEISCFSLILPQDTHFKIKYELEGITIRAYLYGTLKATDLENK